MGTTTNTLHAKGHEQRVDGTQSLRIRLRPTEHAGRRQQYGCRSTETRAWTRKES